MTTANEYLYSRNVRHGVFVERYKSGAVARAFEVLSESDAELVAWLDRTLPAILRRVSNANEGAAAAVERYIRRALRVRDLKPTTRLISSDGGNFAVSESQFQARAIVDSIVQAGAPRAAASAAVARPDPVDVRASFQTTPVATGASARYVWQKLKRLRDADAERVAGALRQGILQDSSKTKVIRRLTGTRDVGYVNGTFHQTRNNVDSETRNITTHARSVGEFATYEENG